MLFGQDIGSDARLAPLVVREHFLLSRLNPRRVTWATPIPVMWSQLSTARLLFMLLCFGLYGATVYSCAREEGDEPFCSGGPPGFSFGDLRSGMLNSLATLLLSFYASSAATLCAPQPAPTPYPACADCALCRGRP